MRQFRWMMPAAALFALAMAGHSAAQEDKKTTQLPGWMAGCWLTVQDEGRRSEECWTPPHGSMMLGSGHMFDARESLSFEHMRIVREGGTIAFIAQPNGAPPTCFSVDRQAPPGGTTPAEVSFINRTNDYPQRVTYRLVNGNLEAEIAMLDGSKAMRWQFRRADTPTH